MSLRAKLIIWFFLAALLPAVVITLFAVQAAADRFSERAVEELQNSTEWGDRELDAIHRELLHSVDTILVSPLFAELVDVAEDEPLPIEPYFAQRCIDELNPGLDFLSIADSSGAVLSSYEWPVFAGKQLLDFERISAMENGASLVGATTTGDGDVLAFRVVRRTGRVTIVAGITFTPDLLKRFRSSSRMNIYLYNAVSRTVVTEEQNKPDLVAALSDYIGAGNSLLTTDRLFLREVRYMTAATPLTAGPGDQSYIIYLFSREELDQTLYFLWVTFFIAAGVGLLLALVLGLMISRRFAGPIEKLRFGFDLLSLGDFTTRLDLDHRDEIGDLVESFNRMAEELERAHQQILRTERIAAWQEVARKIAHEIKNPLSPIQISIETLQKVYERQHPDFEAIFRESSVTILEEVEKIRRIVQEFSDFARMPEPSFESVSLNEVVAKAVRLFKPQMQEVRIVQQLDETPQIEADPDQLHRMLVNIIGNALEAMNRSGVLTLSLRFRKFKRRSNIGSVVLSVEDDGPGMDEETLSRIFTPYFTTRDDGTGLGLVIVQRIVEQHKGKLYVHSDPGEGTRVEIHFPVGK